MNFPFVVYLIAQLSVWLILFMNSNPQIIQSQALITYSIFECLLILLFLALCYKNVIVDSIQPGKINSIYKSQHQKTTQLTTKNQNHQQSFHNQIQSHSKIYQNQKIQKKKYCANCNCNIKLRSFHCQKCQACIATYDHHCSFIGKCIGQKNRHIFFIFCLLQTIQSLYLMIQIVIQMVLTHERPQQSLMILSFSLIVSFLMGTLAIFQTFFMIFNLTMEQIIHRKQSFLYLIKNSRYSKGVFKNCWQFWKAGFTQQFVDWSLNSE